MTKEEFLNSILKMSKEERLDSKQTSDSPLDMERRSNVRQYHVLGDPHSPQAYKLGTLIDSHFLPINNGDPVPDFGKEEIRTTTESNVSFATSLTKGGVVDSSFDLQAPTMRTEALINATAADCAAVRDACKILQELTREKQQKKTLYMVVGLKVVAEHSQLSYVSRQGRTSTTSTVGHECVVAVRLVKMEYNKTQGQWVHSLYTKGAEMH